MNIENLDTKEYMRLWNIQHELEWEAVKKYSNDCKQAQIDASSYAIKQILL